eukprot:Gb_35475 [translate_table: standard]
MAAKNKGPTKHTIELFRLFNAANSCGLGVKREITCATHIFYATVRAALKLALEIEVASGKIAGTLGIEGGPVSWGFHVPCSFKPDV